MSTIEDRVKAVVANTLGENLAAMKLSDRFVEDLGADSLEEVEIVMAIEDEFEFEIPDEDADKIKTVQQAVDYVTSRVKP